MENKLIKIHNLIAQVSVKGEDVFRMADALTLLRQLVQEEQKKGEADTPEEIIAISHR